MLKNYVKLIVAIVFVSNVMAQNIPSYVPKDGLVGWWPFNGNANDESGNGNHGTVNGATLTTDRNGMANSAYSFDGNNNNIKINNLNINEIDNEVNTVSFWMKWDGKEIAMPFCWNGEYDLYLFNNKFGFNTYEDNNIIGISSNDIVNKSVFVVAEFKNGIPDNQNCKLYINGIKQSISGYATKKSKATREINIGSGHFTTEYQYYFSSIIDDIAIYNRALSDQEVKQLYEGCTKETATSNSFNSYVFSNNSSINLSATPTGGTFSGEAVTNNSFNPSKAKLGKNQVKYNFKNSTGCADSTNFEMILVDTLGNKCTETIYDTIKVKESTYDTLKIKVQLTTGIKAGQIATMNVYPNPTSDVVIIEASDVAALNGYSYKMVDLQGKQVYNALATTAKTEISLKSIGAKGMYILHIVDEKGISIENKKIVLE